MFKSVISLGLVLIGLNSVFVNSHQLVPAKFIEFSADCIKDYPVSSDDLKSFKQRIFPETDHASCFIACILKKAGMLDDNGLLSYTAFENAKVFDNEDEFKGIGAFLTTCSKVNEEDVSDGELGCERAKLAFNCFVDNYEKFDFEF